MSSWTRKGRRATSCGFRPDREIRDPGCAAGEAEFLRPPLRARSRGWICPRDRDMRRNGGLIKRARIRATMTRPSSAESRYAGIHGGIAADDRVTSLFASARP